MAAVDSERDRTGASLQLQAAGSEERRQQTAGEVPGLHAPVERIAAANRERTARVHQCTGAVDERAAVGARVR